MWAMSPEWNEKAAQAEALSSLGEEVNRLLPPDDYSDVEEHEESPDAADWQPMRDYTAIDGKIHKLVCRVQFARYGSSPLPQPGLDYWKALRKALKAMIRHPTREHEEEIESLAEPFAKWISEEW